MAHQSLSYRSYRSYKSYASATPPPPANRRCHQASTPHRHICPRATPHCATQTHGVYSGAPKLSDRSDKSDRSDTSATPTQHAYPRCHQVALHTPAVNLRPSQTTLRHCKPSGYTGACHGVARQGEDGRTNLSDLSDWSDRSDTSATPTQHAHRRCHQASKAYPCGKSSPEPNHTAALQTPGVYRGAPTCQTGQTGQTGQTQAPRPRNTHTAAVIQPSPKKQKNSAQISPCRVFCVLRKVITRPDLFSQSKPQRWE